MQTLRFIKHLETNYVLPSHIQEKEKLYKESQEPKKKSTASTPSDSPSKANAPLANEGTAAPSQIPGIAEDSFLVELEPNDPIKPQNWSLLKKWFVSAILIEFITFVSAAGSINSGAIEPAAKHYGVSVEVMALDTALFLTGFGVSSPLWAPMSEVAGRTPVYIIAFTGFILFQIGAACSTTLYARIITRFLAGFCATPPLSNASGAMNDVWTPTERSYTFIVAAVAGFFGPALGPVMGGWIGTTIGFVWCDWVQVIWGGLNLFIVLFILPETFPLQVLKMKAAAIRKRTGDDRFMTAVERARQGVPFHILFAEALKRPFLMMVLEPIVQCWCLYLTVVYIILFGDLIAWSYIFEQTWDLSIGMSGTTFLSICVGLLATLGACKWQYEDYVKAQGEAAEKGTPVPPEVRLKISMYGTWLIPISLFWGAWVAYSDISIWGELVAQAVFGLGILTVFISTFQYIIDSYTTFAASALAAITFLRYPITAGSVMWTGPMYDGMGVHWAMTLLGFISLATCPIPWLFYYYGPKIRSWSKYTPNFEQKPNALEAAVEIEIERIASTFSHRSEGRQQQSATQ